MSVNYQPLVPAVLELNDQGVPVSHQYDDIYYAGSSPLKQAYHVFLHGNLLPHSWRGKREFTVVETGFGLGHNFLALWQAWRRDAHRSPRLHFVSIEAHPFTQPDLAKQLARLTGPEADLAHQLADSWPPLVPGIHRLEFEDGAVTLTLAFGDVDRLVRQLDVAFDACFLDGFSPRVNPEMWTPRVFRQLARMAKRHATLATWCSAGHVRRGLQDAGFVIERQPGFDGKRHRIVGRLRHGMGQSPGIPYDGSVVVVGSGFAGAASAHALARRGYRVSVFDPALSVGPVGTHRGHRAAALTPVLNRVDDIRSRLSRAGTLLASMSWGTFGNQAAPVRCGSFEPIPDESATHWKHVMSRLQFPPDWVRWVDAAEASRLTGTQRRTGGVWHAYGHVVYPEALLTRLLGSPGVTCRAETVHYVRQQDNGLWQICGLDGVELARSGHLVVAAGAQTRRLLLAPFGAKMPRRLNSLHPIAGQLSHFSVAHDKVAGCVLAGDGLCFPGDAGSVIGGSTYGIDTTLSIITPEGHHENRNKVAALLEVTPLQLGRARTLRDGWAGWRAAVRDRLPVIGSVDGAPGLWLACGFGSRGLTWSALGAELLAAHLNHEPVPIERELSKKLSPV